MQQVPKIVRERLQAEAPSGVHPDADVLTAYAEKSLTERERVMVIEHLARCGQCRDVLALALPETPDTQTVVVPARSAWFRWPALRWGLIAAGIIAIASLGVVQYQRRISQTATVAKAVSSPVVAASSQTQPSASSATSSGIADSAREKPRANEDNARTAAKPVSPKLASPNKETSGTTTTERKVIAQAEVPLPRGASRVRSNFGGAVVGGPMMPKQWQQPQAQAQIQASAPVMTTPSAKQQAAGIGGGIGVGAQPTAPSTQQVVVEVENANAQLQTETQDVDNQISNDRYSLSKAKDATTAQAQPASPASTSVAAGPLQYFPRWAINSSGGLQRSFDKGYSWQDVDVTASSAPAKLARAAPAPGGFTDSSTSLKTLPTRPVFRAVAAMGPEVWAGGNNGVLYHSADAGNHWSRVLPIPGVATVGGDVVALEFSDPQRGKITTSTRETWTTGDGGQTWKKQ